MTIDDSGETGIPSLRALWADDAHVPAAHRRAGASGGAIVFFCSEMCRDEYGELFGLDEQGDWVTVSERGGVR